MRERAAERHLVHLRMIYDDGDEYVSVFVDNASATGLLLEGPKPVALGRELRLEPVDRREDVWFELRARVTRCYEIDHDQSIERFGAPMFAIGVELIGVTPVQELAIRKALSQLEKGAIQRRSTWN
jgi:hypothetical protein